MDEKQLKAKFGKQFNKRYQEAHELLTPIVKKASEDEMMAWAMFAQVCNLTVHTACILMRDNVEKGAQMISAGINASLDIRREALKKRKT